MIIKLDNLQLIEQLAQQSLPRHYSNHSLKQLLHYHLPKPIVNTLGYSLEFARRYYEEPLKQHDVLASNAATSQFLRAALADYDHEVFACLFLDIKNRLIEFEILFHGNLNGAEVHSRNLVKRALHYNAAAVILAHNHPSGCPTPSDADRALTHQLDQILSYMDIALLDHIIVAGNQACSIDAAQSP